MLQLTISSIERWDEVNEEFITPKEHVLRLEHSLVSLAKWESKWCKPFLSKEPMTTEETIDYIKHMTITQNVPNEVYNDLTDDNLKQIKDYINNPMTATIIRKDPNAKKDTRMITSELIYYWMIALSIPPEYEKWHLNRLLTLIQVCNVENQPPKKMGRGEILARNKALNDARRKAYNSKG